MLLVAAVALSHVLSFGFQLGKRWYARSGKDSSTQTTDEKEENDGPLGIKYGDLIGGGQFGKIATCFIKDQQYAVKVTEKARQDANCNSEVQPWCLGLDHPNIIKCHGYYMDPDYHIIVMDLHSGGDLYTYIAKNRSIPETDALSMFKQLMDGVMHIHSLNIVHRDIKPENVLLKADRQPVLADFGWATRMTTPKIRGYVGSPLYMAPEVVLDQDYDSKVDIWSCGVTLFTMVNGYLAFDEQQQIVDYEMAEFDEEIGEDTKNIVYHLVQYDPGARRYVQ